MKASIHFINIYDNINLSFSFEDDHPTRFIKFLLTEHETKNKKKYTDESLALLANSCLSHAYHIPEHLVNIEEDDESFVFNFNNDYLTVKSKSNPSMNGKYTSSSKYIEAFGENRRLDRVRGNGLVLSYIDKELRTHDLCTEAVKQNGMALKFVEQHHQTSTLCLEAVKQNPSAIDFIINPLIKEEIERKLKNKQFD